MTEDEYTLRIDIARTVLREEMNRLHGRLMGSLESFGLPDKHENAAKGVVRIVLNDCRTYVDEALTGEYKGNGVRT